MYAIIRAGGKQAKVKAGDVIEIERVKDAAESMTFTPIMVVDEDGATVTDRDALSGAKVVAEVLGETKGDKIDIFKYKNKTGYRRHCRPSTDLHPDPGDIDRSAQSQVSNQRKQGCQSTKQTKED